MKLRANGPRILTIDNGGLQALSILRVLSDVCQALSTADGLPTSTDPHEIFDIIAGVGTGGWLAILLGRYKLSIQQCMGIYISLANAIDPTRKSPSVRDRGLPAAIDQAKLVEKVDKIIAEYEMGDTLLEDMSNIDLQTDQHVCHAFAVGVVKRDKHEQGHKYHLFRAYRPVEGSNQAGPDPTKCKVSAACAATTAAKDFCREYALNGTTYWDDSFPNTHNVSGLALDESSTIFGEHVAPQFVLSISPGIPTDKDIDTLRGIAHKNASTTFKVRHGLMSLPGLRRVYSGNGTIKSPDHRPASEMRSQSAPTFSRFGVSVKRSNTGSSIESFEQERVHQKTIKHRLTDQFRDDTIYHRLELLADKSNERPYLDDIAAPERANKLADSFLKLPQTSHEIDRLISRCRIQVPDHENITENPERSPSPEQIEEVQEIARDRSLDRRNHNTSIVRERELALAW
ncbi:hypothetical protein LTR05_005706 [Lithohypha guttulata]|uniref:PNPLA domain-containing protein n=1 Tax=Lithohypha guttulata TaxID=1690604 RepID=A0AAN7YG86_9EURO|nr:hypothetical protein LTR05_005706 [Lithohypha guttulata]